MTTPAPPGDRGDATETLTGRSRRDRTLLVAAGLAAIFVTWIPTSYSMVRRWMGADGYYSHGLLVPLISAYLVWTRRGDLARAPIRRSGWGLVLVTLGALGQLGSAYTQVAFSSGLSLVLVLAGMVWFIYGTTVFRIVGFPLLFLAFMVPLAMEMLEQASFPMKTFAARAATVVLRDGLGVTCALSGSTTIKFLNSQVDVGDPCSGLRSLIALAALGALVAYLARMSLWRRVLLFLWSIPFALAGNVVRITVLGLVANRWGADAVMGDLIHYGTGFLVFIVALVLLGMTWRLLRIGARPAPREAPPKAPEALYRTAKVVVAVAALKAFTSLFLLQEVADKYLTVDHVAVVKGAPVTAPEAGVPADGLTADPKARLASLRQETAELKDAVRFERFARATIDVNYTLFTLVGVVFLLRGRRWARSALQALAALGIAADAGYVAWLFLSERMTVAPASAGLQALLVSLHLVLYAAASAAACLWTIRRLSTDRPAGAAAVPAENRAPAFGRRAAGMLGVGVFLALVSWWFARPAAVETSAQRAAAIPKTIGEWTGEDFEVEPEVFEILETRDILSRRYKRAGDRLSIELYVVFSQARRRATHPPEICLKGSGWETAHRARLVVNAPRDAGHPVTPFVELVSTHPDGSRLLTYYTYKAGRTYTDRYLVQQWNVVLLSIRGGAGRGALLRFSATLEAGNEEPTREALHEFIRESMPLIEAALEG